MQQQYDQMMIDKAVQILSNNNNNDECDKDKDDDNDEEFDMIVCAFKDREQRLVVDRLWDAKEALGESKSNYAAVRQFITTFAIDVGVCFKFADETIFLAISILDLGIPEIWNNLKSLNLQTRYGLMACTALILANKMDGNDYLWIPIEDFIVICQNTKPVSNKRVQFEKEEFIFFEEILLKSLKHNLCLPTAIEYFSLISMDIENGFAKDCITFLLYVFMADNIWPCMKPSTAATIIHSITLDMINTHKEYQPLINEHTSHEHSLIANELKAILDTRGKSLVAPKIGKRYNMQKLLFIPD